MTTRMPAVFIGHGNPMNVLQHNTYTDSWSALGRRLARPQAILAISAHWYIPEIAVSAMPAPRTIHDFSGFPAELYQLKYPAPGDPVLASRIQALLAPRPVRLDQQWGLDHGAWTVLYHMYPLADIPVVQLSIDARQPAAFHYAVGQQLAPLREEGILVVGSGNLVHNLSRYGWGRQEVAPFDWAVRFEERVRMLIQAGDFAPLVAYETMGADALLSAPSPDHYLPLLYTLALRQPDEPVSFPVEGFEGGSLSMLSLCIGE